VVILSICSKLYITKGVLMKSGRPKKVRFVQKMPKTILFSPRGRPGRPDEVELAIDEFEALKLADFQGFDQAQGAEAMRISRASFGRIVRGARKKIADALVNGKAISIHMGDAQIGVRRKDLQVDTFREEILKFRIRRERCQDIDQCHSQEGDGIEGNSLKSLKEQRI